MKFEIKDLINKIEHAAAKGIEYKDIALTSGIRVETLWKIRKGKQDTTIQVAKRILQAINKLKTNRANCINTAENSLK